MRWVWALVIVVAQAAPGPAPIPLVDLSADTSRQVVVDREPGQYLGHPTTVLLEDGRTILDDGRFFTASGRASGTMTLDQTVSDDGGLTWSAPRGIHSSQNVHLCEPGIVRSPDELLPDGTLVTTTYGRRAEGEPPFVASVRLTLRELDALAQSPPVATDAASEARFAELALACVHKEYPNKIAHVLNGDGDVRPPRELTPAFFGCYDWHSSVHGHWLLARAARRQPDRPIAARARAALAASLTPDRIAGEARYLAGAGRVSFERPYGLAWLLQLSAELREWSAEAAGDRDVRAWAEALAPLEREAVARVTDWLPKLTAPIRIGEHSQTAFSFGLMIDWARAARSRELEALLVRRSRDFYEKDRACPLAYEPSGEDFLSPCLAEADLMRRVMRPAEFGAWLQAFLPGLPTDGAGTWLAPGIVTDPRDPKLGHLDGLNLSRAWMLEAISRALPAGDRRKPALDAAAAIHRERGLKNVTAEHYEGGHWLGTFAMYLLTGRGVSGPPR